MSDEPEAKPWTPSDKWQDLGTRSGAPEWRFPIHPMGRRKFLYVSDEGPVILAQSHSGYIKTFRPDALDEAKAWIERLERDRVAALKKALQ